MSRGGNNRKPRTAKIIQGTFRKDRNPRKEPTPTLMAGPPKPPSGLNRWARREWKRLAAELHDQELLSVVDLPALEIACAAYGVYRECFERIRKNYHGLGEYLDVPGENSHTRPLFSAARHGWAAYKSYLVEFGLSPVSRNRVEVSARKQGQDPMERLLNEM